MPRRAQPPRRFLAPAQCHWVNSDTATNKATCVAVEGMFGCEKSTCASINATFTPFLKLRGYERKCIYCPLDRYALAMGGVAK